MEEVSKAQFKEIFLKYGKVSEGYGPDYWDEFYAAPEREDMKYLIDLPSDPAASRMMVVTDYSSGEYRLFFMTEDQEDSFFR